MADKNKQFDLEHQYQLYLGRVNLSESKMHPTQCKVLRDTFFGAVGQTLILLRDEVGELEEAEAIVTMKSLLDQVGNHFIKSAGRQN